MCPFIPSDQITPQAQFTAPARPVPPVKRVCRKFKPDSMARTITNTSTREKNSHKAVETQRMKERHPSITPIAQMQGENSSH
ncbi:MAG: hypothetical protein GQF41_1662 [Candidatus Rifleibacterium amylolyticum]|nr:MAG: hypothetical protein GQF41_1662 [Candidatus Rifleibacterium amylolyticum]